MPRTAAVCSQHRCLALCHSRGNLYQQSRSAAAFLCRIGDLHTESAFNLGARFTTNPCSHVARGEDAAHLIFPSLSIEAPFSTTVGPVSRWYLCRRRSLHYIVELLSLQPTTTTLFKVAGDDACLRRLAHRCHRAIAVVSPGHGVMVQMKLAAEDVVAATRTTLLRPAELHGQTVPSCCAPVKPVYIGCSNWRPKSSGEKEVDEVLETKDDALKRPLLTDGRQLTATQEQDADERVQRLIRDSNPLRKSMREENEDDARSQRLLKMLPNALISSFGEHRGDTVELNFKPHPHSWLATPWKSPTSILRENFPPEPLVRYV
jgi:hypothetical protein